MADNYVEAISTLDKLYSLLERRLEQAGNSLPCTMEALHIYASSPRSDTDYLDLINLDNQSLFDSVYMITASNIPRSDYAELWEERIKSLPKEKFHMEFMNCLGDLSNLTLREIKGGKHKEVLGRGPSLLRIE